MPATTRSLKLDVLPLAAAQTLVWAALYYSFPALLPAWEADLGWSKPVLSGAFTAALVTTALLAPWAGRLIDRGRAHLVHPLGAAAGALLLAALALVESPWQFYALWFGIGVTMAFSLYEAAFAILTTTLGPRAREAITTLTLVAGFAGTVSFPSAHWLAARFGWRGAVLVFAAAILALALPLMRHGLARLEHHRAPPPATANATDAGADGPRPATVTRRPAFRLLAFAFGTIGLVQGMVITHLLPILADRGIGDAVAVVAAAMIGPMQVAGRVLLLAFEKRLSTFAVAFACFIGMAGGAAALLLASVVPALVAVFVFLHGAGYGTASIVRPVLTAEVLGRAGFGVVAGMLAIPFIGGFALGPTVAALIWELGGYDLVLLAAATAALAGLAAVIAARRAG